MTRTLIRIPACVIALALAVLGSGCEDRPQQASEQPAEKTRGEPTGIYTVRGVVISLPDPKKPGGGSDLQIRHERIPEFKDAAGVAIGMNAMIMPFPLAKGVTLDGVAVDDKVEFTFAAWMQPGQRGWELRTIRKLPSDTPLDFTAAGPAPVKPAEGSASADAPKPESAPKTEPAPTPSPTPVPGK